MRQLVLWDIDGTLVDGAGVGREVFLEAFTALTGRAPDPHVGAALPLAGRTDPEIALELFARHGIAERDVDLPAFFQALAAAMAAKAPALRARGRALPGAREALAALAGHPEVVQSALTGNVRPNAEVKLATFGLDGYLDFSVGGYGSDHRRRPELVAVARRRARERYGLDGARDSIVLVGDTPMDVAAAREGGARAVAVASGLYGVEELRRAGADAVLPSLEDTAAVVAAVLGGGC